MNDLIVAPKNEIVVYQPNETMRLEVMFKQDTVWLNRQQIAQLFGRDVKTIGRHIANALKEELAPTVAKFATVHEISYSSTCSKNAQVHIQVENPTVAKWVFCLLSPPTTDVLRPTSSRDAVRKPRLQGVSLYLQSQLGKRGSK